LTSKVKEDRAGRRVTGIVGTTYPRGNRPESGCLHVGMHQGLVMVIVKTTHNLGRLRRCLE
jgi:hypothetical protein